MSLTRAWASSKSPSIASAWQFVSTAVVICRRCTSLTRPCGNRMNTSTFGRPRNASIAALPVSPLVAPTMVIRSPVRASAACIICPMICMAKSLKASVGPWNSSSRKWLGPSCTSGARAAW